MTKAKAKKLMVEYSRSVIDSSFANKITKAFGFSLQDLNIEPQTTEEILGEFCPEETRTLKAVSVYTVAQSLALKISGNFISSNKFGRGSSADEIVSKSVELI